MATGQYATFEVAGQLFGVPVEAVQEVLSFHEYTAVPLASPAVGGLFNLRGQVIAAVDLRVQLGLPRRSLSGPVWAEPYDRLGRPVRMVLPTLSLSWPVPAAGLPLPGGGLPTVGAAIDAVAAVAEVLNGELRPVLAYLAGQR